MSVLAFQPQSSGRCNTLISKWNASAASFEYSNGFIWIYSAVDPTNFKIHADESDSSTSHSVSSMGKRMSGKSWLVRAKLVFRLERSSRERAAILAELLEVSHIQVTSSHKPITHSQGGCWNYGGSQQC
jgi:hypothetical protein